MEDITLSNSSFIIAMVGMLALLMLEATMAGTWNRFYFTFGLPIFIKRVPVSVFSFPPLDFGQLEAEFSATWSSKSLVFKEFEPGVYAFREKLLEMRWGKSSSEVMHGLLILDQNAQQVVVKGYANWWLLGLVLLFVAFFLMMGTQGVWFIGLLVLIMAFVYWTQARRFAKVAQFVAEQVMGGRNRSAERGRY